MRVLGCREQEEENLRSLSGSRKNEEYTSYIADCHVATRHFYSYLYY